METPKYSGYYEDEAGFRAWNERCRLAMRRPVPKDDSAFARLGFEKLTILPAAQAKKVLDHVRALAAIEREPWRPDPYIRTVMLPKKEYARLLLVSLLNREVDERLVGFFGSEYMVKWFNVACTSPHPVSEISFLWHRDFGPALHVKLMLYLNGTAEHGARTDFVDEESTVKMLMAGYGFPGLDDRKADLGGYAAPAGVPWPPPPCPVGAGEAVLFKPNLVLHRGILPSTGPRYVLHVCLVPSPLPWRQHFERQQVRDYQVGEAMPFEQGFPEELATRNAPLRDAIVAGRVSVNRDADGARR